MQFITDLAKSGNVNGMELHPAGEDVPIVWNGRRVRAFVPAPLSARELALDSPTAVRAALAAAEVGRAAEALKGEHEVLARLLLRSEGVASSYIEGITAPVVDVVVAEQGLAIAGGGAAAWVAASLTSTSAALDQAMQQQALDLSTLCEWHRLLLAGTPTPERLVGRIREVQGWIGGTSPLDAHLVTPPPDRLAQLLDDLLAWVNRDDLDPIAQAAVAHAQFEIIHPFADGNGRVGRILVAWLLVRRLALMVPPPVSAAIAADTGGYASGLVRFRLGDHLGWIGWFADAVAGGGRSQRELVAAVEALTASWRARLVEAGLRRDSVVHAAIELLPRHPVLTSSTLVEQLGTTRKAALATLGRLVELGILHEQGTLPLPGPGQPPKLYAARDLLGLAGATPLR